MAGVTVITMVGAEAITTAGAIITIGEKNHCLAVIILKEAAAVWRLFHLSQSASAAWRLTQKPPRFPSTARAVAFLRGGALRRAVLERGASSCLDALPQLGGLLRCQCVGSTIPDPCQV